MPERLTALWHEEQHSRADHAAPRLRARRHLHAVGRVELQHFDKSPGGVCVDLFSLSYKNKNKPTNQTLTFIIDLIETCLKKTQI